MQMFIKIAFKILKSIVCHTKVQVLNSVPVADRWLSLLIVQKEKCYTF